MRVLHFVHTFSPLSETFIYDYIMEMQRQGIDCHVLTLERQNAEERPFRNVHLITLPPKWSVKRIIKKAKSIMIKVPVETYYESIYHDKMHKILEQIRPDVIHAHFGPAGVLIAPVAKSLNIPFVVTFYGYDVSKLPREEVWSRRYRGLFEQADSLLGISKYICDSLISLGAEKSKVLMVRNGIDLNKFKYSDPSKRFDGKTVQLIFIGRLVAKKGPVHLIDALNLARMGIKNGLELSLTVIGDGPLQKDVEGRIKCLELSQCVQTLGALPHNEIVKHLRTAHLYVQHSITAPDGDQEGLGISLIEASATGLPVISTLHDGIPEVVLGGITGRLVPEGDIRAMADQIMAIAENPALWAQYGKEGRKRVEGNFHLPEQVSKLIGILENAGKKVNAQAPR